VVQGQVGVDLKHNKVHLLIIGETGKVKTRKIPISLIKWVVIVLVILFVLTSFFTYLYLRGIKARHVTKYESGMFLKEIDRLRARAEEQELEISRLKGAIARLKRENEDLKHHIITKKLPPPNVKLPPKKPPVDKNIEAYLKLLSQIEGVKAKSKETFHIRDPKIVVSRKETTISFKLYKDTLKSVYGRYILLGIYKPEDTKKVGEVVAFPRKGISNFKLRPAFGRSFKIERGFLAVMTKLPHPNGVTRFSEFHIFVYGVKKELLYHEQFNAP